MGPSSAPDAPSNGVPRLAHSLTLSSGAVFATSISIQLIGFVGSFFLMHRIGAPPGGQALLGTAQLFLLIGSSINGVGDLRLGSAYCYFLARGKPPQENTATYLGLRLSMVGAAGLVLFVFAPLSFGGLGAIAQGGTQLTSLGIFLTLPLLWTLSTVYNQMYIGLGNSLRAQFPSLIEALVRLPVLIYVAFTFTTGSGAILGVTVAYAIGAAASALFSLPTVLPRVRGFRRSEASHLFRYAWPLMGSLLLGYLVTNMIPLIVATLGRDQLSIFLAANGWRILVLSVPGAVTTPLFPYLAGLHQREEYESVRRGTWQALRYSAMLLVPGVIALVTYRFNFLNDFAGLNYAQPGNIPLAILAAGALPLALSQIMQSSINAIGRQRLELYITSTQVGVLFATVALVMPPWGLLRIFSPDDGLIAAAIAVLVSSAASLALNTYFMESLIRVHIRPGPIVAITGSAAGSFGVLWLFTSSHSRLQLLPVNGGLQLFLAVLLGFGVYFLILAGVGELTRNDVRTIARSLGLPARLYEPVARVCWRESAPDLAPIDLARAPGLRATELPGTFTGTREMPDLAPPLPDQEPPDPRARP